MSKIDYQDLSAKIMDNIGGVKNVKTVTHCVTRLRFYLHDRNIAEDSEIKNCGSPWSSIWEWTISDYIGRAFI